MKLFISTRVKSIIENQARKPRYAAIAPAVVATLLLTCLLTAFAVGINKGPSTGVAVTAKPTEVTTNVQPAKTASAAQDDPPPDDIQVEQITIGPAGCEPPAITRPAGPFV